MRKAVLLAAILAMAGMAPPFGFVAAGQPQQPAPAVQDRRRRRRSRLAGSRSRRQAGHRSDPRRDHGARERRTPDPGRIRESLDPGRGERSAGARGTGPAGCRQQRVGRPVTGVRARARQPSRQRDSRPDGQGPRPAVRRELRRPGRLRRRVLARRAAGGDAGFHHRQGAAARRDRSVHRHEDDVGGRRVGSRKAGGRGHARRDPHARRPRPERQRAHRSSAGADQHARGAGQSPGADLGTPQDVAAVQRGSRLRPGRRAGQGAAERQRRHARDGPGDRGADADERRPLRGRSAGRSARRKRTCWKRR